MTVVGYMNAAAVAAKTSGAAAAAAAAAVGVVDYPVVVVVASSCFSILPTVAFVQQAAVRARSLVRVSADFVVLVLKLHLSE